MRISALLESYLPDYSYEVVGDADFDTLGLVVSEVNRPFCTFLEDYLLIDKIDKDASMIITTPRLAKELINRQKNVCIVEQPRVVFFKLHNALESNEEYVRQRIKTRIGKNCNISSLAVISPQNVVIGDNVMIEEFVVIRENTTIGDNCIIHSGSKIGFSDFEYKKENNGRLFGVKHYGGVNIGNDVEISVNSCVNKALYPWDDTVIGDNCKIDMLVQVSHGVKIGNGTMIVGLSGIGGRTVIGANCWVGYGCIVRNGITIGNNARLNMGAVVTKSVKDNVAVTGNFAINHELFMRNLKEAVSREIDISTTNDTGGHKDN